MDTQRGRARTESETEAKPRLFLLLSKEEVNPKKLAGGMVVVLDVFLAGTTILTILENGAKSVQAISSLDELKELKGFDRNTSVTGGEILGEKPADFDCGPYPGEFPPSVVMGKSVVHLSTNCSQAMRSATTSRELWVGCLRNAPAISRYLDRLKSDIWIVCAGSGGHPCLEDFVAASVILSGMSTDNWISNDAALMAKQFGQSLQTGRLAEMLSRGRLGRWLVQRNCGEVIEFASEVGGSKSIVTRKDSALVLMAGSF